jgi:cytochrome b561
MMITSPARYSTIAIALHWLIAVLLVMVMVLGLALDDLEDEVELAQLLGLHRSIGMTIFGLTVLRVVWRMVHRPPPMVDDLRWRQMAARFVHLGFYLLMLGMPISGYLATILRGREVVIWNLVTLPSILGPDKPLARLFTFAHDSSQFLVYGLLAAHVGAALYHQFIVRDGMIWRMIPAGGGAGSGQINRP